MSKRYELEFDIWRPNRHGGSTPQRVKVIGTTRAYAEKRMRDVVYKYGGYQGRYVAFYPNGQVKDSKVIRPSVKDFDDQINLQMNSAIVSREFHYGFGKKDYKR